MTVYESLAPEVFTIQDEVYRKLLSAMLKSRVKEDFLIMPAARSNHHPPDERGEGGLLLHTKRVLQAANIIMDSIPDNVPLDRDGIRAACILHDAGRPVSHIRHPQIMHDELMEMAWYDMNRVPAIANMVLRHMGRWGDDLPLTKEDWIVHLSDATAAKYY